MSSFSPFGNDLFGDPIKPRNLAPVSQRFVIPPFSVLSARDGEWQELIVRFADGTHGEIVITDGEVAS